MDPKQASSKVAVPKYELKRHINTINSKRPIISI